MRVKRSAEVGCGSDQRSKIKIHKTEKAKKRKKKHRQIRLLQEISLKYLYQRNLDQKLNEFKIND